MQFAEEKNWVFELIPMHLLDEVEKIAMISLLILYNTNQVPFAICALTLIVNLEQQRSNVEEELQEVDTSIPTKGKKNKRKAACKVNVREMSMKVNCSNLSISRNFQSCATVKKKMTGDEIPSSDILTWPDICSIEPLQMAIVAREDDVKDFNDDNIGMEMNTQVPLE